MPSVDSCPSLRRTWSAPCTLLGRLAQGLSATSGLADAASNDTAARGMTAMLFPKGSTYYTSVIVTGDPLASPLIVPPSPSPCPAEEDAAVSATAPTQAAEGLRVAAGGGEPSAAPSTPPDPGLSREELVGLLHASRLQIQLLNKTNEKTLSLHRELEERNRTLQKEKASLMLENEELREKLQAKDDEIDEQLHVICELEREMNALRAKLL